MTDDLRQRWAESARSEAEKTTLSPEEARVIIRKELGILELSDLTDSEKTALLNKKECAECPQPVDYGLTYDDAEYTRAWRRENFRYKKGRRWFGGKGRSVAALIAFASAVSGVALTFFTRGPTLSGMICLGFAGLCLLWKGWTRRYHENYSSSSLEAFKEALQRHELYKAAEQEAEQAALRKKRSYWTVLDGYSFEQATAEVLRKHQFTAMVTRGSGDGGVDIKVTRNGLKGVVQCKAHINCIGPSVVRDLYGVIHHSGAAFGIVVSRGGFTRGAGEFARDKPILFLDTDDLIAMQEGRDVLAKEFTPKKT